MFYRDEKERRKVNPIVDLKPSFSQTLSYKYIQSYIKNKKVLDIGCWSGQIEQLAIKDVKEIIGIDPGKGAIDFAKKHVPKANFMVGTIDSLPFKNNSFDVVLLLEVLEHIPKNTEISGLREINRVLKNKGVLILTTPNENFFSILLDPAFFLLGHRHYSKNKLRKLLEQSGSEIIELVTAGGFIKGVFENVSLLSKHILKKKIGEPNWIKKSIEKEYLFFGFLTNRVVARKH